MRLKHYTRYAGLVRLAFCVLVAGCADAEPERPLYERLLASDNERNAALEEVLRDARRVDAFSLLLAADRAQQVGRIADAAFLLNAGRIRATVDKEAYPEADETDNRPSLMLNTLEHSTSRKIGFDIAADRDAYSRVIGRLHEWRPRIGRGYDPGWLYENELDETEANSLLAVTKQVRLDQMRDLARLLADDEYFSLIKEVKKLQSGSALGPEIDEQRLEIVVRRGREIERDKNIDGAFSSLE